MAEVEKDDLLADVRAAAEGLESPDPVTEVTREQPEETAQERADRARDEQGRFAKEDEKPRETLKLKPKETPAGKSTPSAPDGEARTAQTPADAQPPSAAGAASPPAEKDEFANPPAEWKGAAKVDWRKLPAAVRAEIGQDYQNMARSREAFAPVEQAIMPYRDAWIRDAGSVDRAISQLGQFYQLYVENPVGLIQHIARTRGIDLGQPAGQQPQAQGGIPQTPDINSLIEQRLQQKLAPIEQRFAQAEEQQLTSIIQSFAADPRYPYFNDVKVQMGQLMQGGIVPMGDMAAAYDKAVKLNDAIQAQLEAQRAEEARNSSAAEAERARRAAAASLRGSPLPNGHSGGGAGSNASVLDDVRAAAAELSGS